MDPSTGERLTGWKFVNNYWYDMDPSTGLMQTGWIQWKGDWYYLKENGAMAYNTTIEGYFLGADGAMR